MNATRVEVLDLDDGFTLTFADATGAVFDVFLTPQDVESLKDKLSNPL